MIGTAQAPKGSYGINEWVYDSDASGNTNGRSATDYWRNTGHKGLNNVPVMGDGSVRSDIQPCATDSPPSYEGEPRLGVGNDEMRFFCIDRHDAAINMLFMDWTARAVGLKELWTLKWNCSYNLSSPWTKPGGVQPQDWPQWMQSFKDY